MEDKCPFLGKECSFFDTMLAKNPTVAELMKKRYTEGKFRECARFVLIEKGESPPSDLWPSGARTNQI